VREGLVRLLLVEHHVANELKIALRIVFFNDKGVVELRTSSLRMDVLL